MSLSLSTIFEIHCMRAQKDKQREIRAAGKIFRDNPKPFRRQARILKWMPDESVFFFEKGKDGLWRARPIEGGYNGSHEQAEFP